MRLFRHQCTVASEAVLAVLILLTAFVSCGPNNKAGYSRSSEAQSLGQLNLADPFIVLEGDYYYAFGTESDEGFHCYRSLDLTKWERVQGNAPGGFALNKVQALGDRYFWAPEAYKVDGSWYMLYSANENTCIATAPSIDGPYTTYGNGLLTNNPHSIDNTLFIDDDGTKYMYWVRWDLGRGNEIWGAEMTDDMKGLTSRQASCIFASEPWELLLGQVAEGPTVFKRDGVYYMTYSANDYRSKDYAVGFATASSPLGPWTKYSGNPILRRVGDLVGTGHSSVFRAKDGSLKMVFHAHNSAEKVHPRQMYITDLEFVTKNGQTIISLSPDFITPTRYERL